jgi:hypothetical protein
MEETYTYLCHYCQKEYIPKKRKVQKFCSAGCRVRAHQVKNKDREFNKELENDNTGQNADADNQEKSNTNEPVKVKNTVNLPDVTNSFLGTFAAIKVQQLLTKDSKKSITKADMETYKNLENGNRYRKVQNWPTNEHVYFDTLNDILVLNPKDLMKTKKQNTDPFDDLAYK